MHSLSADDQWHDDLKLLILYTLASKACTNISTVVFIFSTICICTQHLSISRVTQCSQRHCLNSLQCNSLSDMAPPNLRTTHCCTLVKLHALLVRHHSLRLGDTTQEETGCSWCITPHDLYLRNSMQELWPPKPNEFERATLISCCCFSDPTRMLRSTSSSGSSRFRLGCRKPMHHSQITSGHQVSSSRQQISGFARIMTAVVMQAQVGERWRSAGGHNQSRRRVKQWHVCR